MLSVEEQPHPMTKQYGDSFGICRGHGVNELFLEVTKVFKSEEGRKSQGLMKWPPSLFETSLVS